MPVTRPGEQKQPFLLGGVATDAQRAKTAAGEALNIAGKIEQVKRNRRSAGAASNIPVMLNE